MPTFTFALVVEGPDLQTDELRAVSTVEPPAHDAIPDSLNLWIISRTLSPEAHDPLQRLALFMGQPTATMKLEEASDRSIRLA